MVVYSNIKALILFNQRKKKSVSQSFSRVTYISEDGIRETGVF